MTDFTTPKTWSVNELVTAAMFNTHMRDNQLAIWVGTTAGDMEYYVNSVRKARIAIGTNGQILQVVSGVPTWVEGSRYWATQLNDASVALAVGDDAARFRIPPALNGWKVTYVAASRKSGGTGVPAFQLRNVTAGVDILSTKLTIDSGEVDSSTAATAAVINSSNATVSTNQTLAWDVDVAGTNTLIVAITVGFTRS